MNFFGKATNQIQTPDPGESDQRTRIEDEDHRWLADFKESRSRSRSSVV
jgi:hypothetical protein